MSTPEAAAPAPSRQQRLWRSAAWLVGSNLSSQVLRLLGNLILTRLLVPEDFGLMAAVNTLFFALIMFSDMGVWQSVVKSPQGEDPRFLGTAWSVQLGRGVLLGGAVLAMVLGLQLGQTAGWMAAGTVYADPRLPQLMAVFALCALLQGAESMKLALAQRALQTGALVRLDLAVQLLTLTVTLLLAWQFRSVWALLAGTLCGSLLRATLSHLLLPGPKIRPCWERAHVHELIGFGKWILLSSIVGFLAAHGEKLLLGAALGTAMFGVFSLAANLLAALIGLYSTVNARLVFPALSQALRDNDEATLNRAYGRAQRLVDLLLGGASGALFMAGHWLVWWLYDARYHDAGWMLQWLGLGLLAMRQQVVEQWMFARGKPAWVTANNLLRVALLAIAVPLGLAWDGERGAIIGVVLSQFGSWPLSMWFRHRQGVLGWRAEAWWPLALLGGLAAGAAFDQGMRWLAP